MEKVKIFSTVSHTVTVYVPAINFSRTWPRAGAFVSLELEKIEELMNDIGFMNMLESGMLYIEDMAAKKALGLEPEDAVEPTNIIVLSDKDKQAYLTTLSLVGFKDKVKKLSQVQLGELCDYAIDHKLANFDKAKVLKEACGRDILAAIKLNEQDKED